MEGVVSVPSRGILFPNEILFMFQHLREKFPSPLGVSYFQMDVNALMQAVGTVGFPSPLGVSYFQIKQSKIVIQ